MVEMRQTISGPLLTFVELDILAGHDVSEKDLGEGGDVTQQAVQGVLGDLGEGVVGWSEDSERSEVGDGLLGEPGGGDGSHQGGELGVGGESVEHVLGGLAAAVARERRSVRVVLRVKISD